MQNEQPPATDGFLFQRFKTSVVSYGIRQFVVILLALGSNILLTRYLLPAEFGRIAVIMMVITVATLLADGGFGVYLIQRHAELIEHDLWRVTTIQLYAAGLLSGLCFLGAAISFFYLPGNHLGWMIAAASLSLPLLVVRGMALLLLERSIRIDKIVRVEVLEQVVYAATAIGLAIKGAGAWSIVIAQLCKAAAGCLSAVLVGKFRFKLVPVTWDEDLKQGFRFGLHYQAALLINMARISIVPLYIVPMFGFEAAGFIERALYFSGAPLAMIQAVQNKTMFPYIARIQFDKANIRRFTEDSIFLSAIVDKIMFLPMLVFAPAIIEKIFGAHWSPMLPLIYWLLAGNIIFGALVGALYPVANGLGRSDYVSRLNFAGFVLAWILMVPLTLQFGILGIGIAAFIMWFGIFWMKKKITEEIGEFYYYRQIVKPLIAMLLAWVIMLGLIHVLPQNFISLKALIGWSAVASLLYIAIVLILERKRITRIISDIKMNKYSGETIRAQGISSISGI